MAQSEGFEPGTVPRTLDFEKAMVSTQQLAIVDLAGQTKILLDSSIDTSPTQPSLIDPVVLQRQALEDSLARYLARLALCAGTK